MGASALSREGVMAQISHHHHYQHHHRQHHLASFQPTSSGATVWDCAVSLTELQQGGTLAVSKVVTRLDVRANVSQMCILRVRISAIVCMSMEFECVVV